jgi:hypothetical protein
MGRINVNVFLPTVIELTEDLIKYLYVFVGYNWPRISQNGVLFIKLHQMLDTIIQRIY